MTLSQFRVTMSTNPYQSAELEDRKFVPPDSDGEHSTTGLAVLCVLVILQILVSLGLLGLCLVGGVAMGIGGAMVSLIYDVVILVGLIRKQEWARLNLIFMNYTTIFFVVLWAMSVLWIGVPMIALNLISALVAHSASVKRITKGHSVAKTYTYGQQPTED